MVSRARRSRRVWVFLGLAAAIALGLVALCGPGAAGANPAEARGPAAQGDPRVDVCAVAIATPAAEISGRPIALADAADGSEAWARPPGRLLLALADVRIGPGAKLAWLEVEVTGDDGVPRRLEFSLKHTERGWVPLEWGPADHES